MTPAQAIVKLAELGLPTEKLGAALAILEAMEEGLQAPMMDRRERDRERKKAERASKDVHGNPRTSQDNDGHAQDICNKKEIPHTPLEKTTTIVLPTARAKPDVSRGTRLPVEFTPLPAIVELGKLRGLTDFEITDQLERFRDWANAATGQVGTKRDWQAAFRNWIKRAADDKRKSQSRFSPKPSPGQAITDAFDDLDRHIAGRRAEAGHG